MEKVNCTNCGTENTTSNKYCSSCGYELPKLTLTVVESAPVGPDTFTTKINRRKGLFGAIFGIILFVLVILLVKSFFFNSSMIEKIKASAADNAMTRMAEQLNKSCPVDVDQYTRLDNIKVLPGRILKFNYTLSINKSDVNVDELKGKIEPQILSNIKDSPQMQLFRSNKMTFVHNYCDKNGETILEITIPPDLYEQ